MRNREIFNSLFMLIQYLIITYGNPPPRQLIYLKQETKGVHYIPQSLIGTVFNQVKDILEYGELARSPYTHIQTASIS